MFSNRSVAIPTAALTIIATYLARLWAERGLAYGETLPLVGDLLRLTRGENAGGAFGLFDGSRLVPWLAVLALAAAALILARPLRGSRAGAVALALILGGGVANLSDRLDDGSVTDYLDLGLGSWRWPTFNLPDVAITFGVCLALWVLFKKEDA